MLRLFKRIGIGNGVDLERRDNRGKTAMEIMEGRWDLTEEFRREFVELVDGMREEEGSQGRDGVAEEEDVEVATVEAEDLDESEDVDLSEDEFFDAPDDLTSTLTAAPEEQELVSFNGEPPESDLENSPSTDPSLSNTEAISSTLGEQQDLGRNGGGNNEYGEEGQPGEAEMAIDCSIKATSTGDQNSGICGLDRTDGLAQGSDAGQEKSRKPRGEEPNTEKVFMNEAGLKFRGTSTALRSR